jgi:DNA helicase HerA-like ATPase
MIDVLVRIAMEGRKYGLFLILVTQRPGRVNTNLLSQCDDLCLMKMSNPADVELVGEQFGFVPSGWAERALTFKKGEVRLSGLSRIIHTQSGKRCSSAVEVIAATVLPQHGVAESEEAL